MFKEDPYEQMPPIASSLCDIEMKEVIDSVGASNAEDFSNLEQLIDGEKASGSSKALGRVLILTYRCGSSSFTQPIESRWTALNDFLCITEIGQKGSFEREKTEDAFSGKF